MTRTQAATLRLLVVLVAIAALGIVSRHNVCAPVDVTNVSDAHLARLFDAGYVGRPDDGREAVYSPSC